MKHTRECGCREVSRKAMVDGRRIVLEAREKLCGAFLQPCNKQSRNGAIWKEMDRRKVRIKIGNLKAQC